VGSILRSKPLKEARLKREKGAISAAQLKEVEDREIEKIIRKQEEIGLKLATDGEYRRSWWHFDFFGMLKGVEVYDSDHGIQFQGVQTKARSIRVSGKIHFDDLQFEKSYAAMAAYGQSKLAVLMFARELDKRSRAGGWGIVSNAAHPGLTKTNLQVAGPSHGREKPALMERLYKLSWRFTPFLWQEIDEGILPALYAAATPHAEGGAFYGPSGFYEAAGGGVALAKVPANAKNDDDSARLWEISEQLTGVSYPKPN
jgi:hypothetical protein